MGEMFKDYIPVNILKHKGRDCSNSGMSSYWDDVYLCLNGWRPTEQEIKDKPFVAIVQGHGRYTVRAIPIDGKDANAVMFGGCYISTCDSRFSKEVRRVLNTWDNLPDTQDFYGAVAFHDRREW